MKTQRENIITFTLTYNKYKRQVYNYVLRMVSDQMTCEDIVQNIFTKFFENMRNIKNRESYRYWIFTTARNEIFTHYKKKKIHTDKFGAADSDELELESGEDILLEYEKAEIRELIMKELDEMPPDQKDPFILKEYGELSYREIASVMGIDEKLVKSRLYKTRQKLIKKISQYV